MASIEIKFTHPSVSVTKTLSTTDARLVEFLDYFVAEGPDPGSESRVDAASRYGDLVLARIKEQYKGYMKQAQPPVPNIDDPDA